jgi:superfamily I DNA/RNA helicase
VGVSRLEGNALKVVRSTGHRSVLAGPGAGKTELLAQRAAYLLQTGACPAPLRILAIAFKRDAARNLALRVAQRCQREHASRLDSVTFDAFAKNLLDRFGQALPLRWRPTPDYEILLPKADLFREFLRSASESRDRVGTAAQIHAIMPGTFERRFVVAARLPEDGWLSPSPAQWAADAFWQHMLHDGKRSMLTFPMIGRLAELLLRVNETARRAHALTYSHVFMDEFQDTTQVQYDLIHTLFLGTDTLVTAVGDNKQQIMRWAMAMEAPFDVFEADFGARRIPLLNNYRSSPDLVRIQHVLAQALDAGAPLPVSNTEGTVSGDCCAVWDFDSARAEARHLATYIAGEMKSHGLQPRDFVLLVRQKADGYAQELAPHFAAAGLRLCNQDASVGALKLQELLTEDLSIACMLLLRVAMTRNAGAAWVAALRTLEGLMPAGFDPSDANYRRLSKSLDHFASGLADSYPDPPTSQKQAAALVRTLTDFLGRDRLKAAHPAYAQGDWFAKVEDSVTQHLLSSAASASDWISTLDVYECRDAIGLMTIHKSKGLEYHTVVFVGLDDAAWWSYTRETTESTAGFFVAFTRAKQRVIFTYCPTRGNRNDIQPLYALLGQAGVPTIRKA